MPRFAAIDVGSNASRLLIVQAKEPHRARMVLSERIPVRLGHGVFQTGELDPQAIDESVAAMRRFAVMMEDARVDDYRAVVTASARSAKNGNVLLERVRREAGVKLESIDGIEEARLVALAVRHAMPLRGRTLLMDLGGGSLELSEVNASGENGFTISLPIGTVRLLEAFLDPGRAVSESQDKLIREYLDRILAPHTKKLSRKPWDSVVGTGGNFTSIAALCPNSDSVEARFTLTDARMLLTKLASLSSEARCKAFDLRPDRADVIIPALYVVDVMAELTRANFVSSPGVGLKEGVVTELVEKHYRVWDYEKEDDKVLAAALHVGRRYHFDERHAMQVTDFAARLFDATAPLHGLGARSRIMLKLASMLHDVGDFIHPQSHHKHSQYIIEHSDFVGVSTETRSLVALIARYHRRSTPNVKQEEFKALNAEDRERVRRLAGLLRVADALDRAHLSKVKLEQVRLESGTLTLELSGKEDLALEVWTVERKADLFREAFSIDLRIRVTAK